MSGATKTKRMPRAVREQQMLDAAVQTFAERGYRSASMDDIAELAGVSKPLVYLYLNSKEDLFAACIRREAATLVAAIRAGVERGATADRQLWSGLHGFFAHTAEHPHGWALLHVQARTQGEPFAQEVAAMRTEIVEFVTATITEAVRESGCESPGGADRVRREPGPRDEVRRELAERELSGLAHALVGAAESLAEWVRAYGEGGPSAREAAATMMNFAWTGLGHLMRGDRWSPSGRPERG